MSTTTEQAPRVGDWWMCPACGDTNINRPIVGRRSTYPHCPHHWNVEWAPLTLTEADWLKCKNVDALVDMVVNHHGLHKEVARSLTEPAIRCIFGNPFRPWTPDADVLAWRDGTVRWLADGKLCWLCSGKGEELWSRSNSDGYRDVMAKCQRCGGAGREPVDHVILADALEEAGETRDDVLRHLREPGQHWPGCHVLRAILGGQQ